MRIVIGALLVAVAECSSIFSKFKKKNTLCKGDVRLKTEADVRAIQHCTKIEGNLFVNFSYNGAIKLPELIEITGKFEAHKVDGLTAVELPILKSIGDICIRACKNYKGPISLPGLVEVNGGFYASRVDGLTAVELPILKSIGGCFYIGDCQNYKGPISLPGLVEVNGDFFASRVDGLTAVELPILKSIGGYFCIAACKDLQTIAFPFLQTIDEKCEISKNSNLKKIEMSDLTTISGTCIIYRNKELAEIYMPKIKADALQLSKKSSRVQIESLLQKAIETQKTGTIFNIN